jgi:membrane fusion protein (multidrug efflux system)
VKKVAFQIVLPGMLAIMLFSCSSKGDTDTGKGVKAERPPVAVETQKVAPSEITEGIDVVGTLTPKVETEVKSQILGLVREVYVTEWVSVKKNAPLARIDVSEIEALARKAEAAVESAKAGYLQTQVAAKRAEREKERMSKLKEFGLATQQGLEDAETEAAAAVARVEAARAQIRAAEEELRYVQARASRGLIRSPMDGIVSLRDVNVGDLASDTGAAKPLFKIVDNHILNLTVTVPSVEMAGLRVGNPLTFTVDSMPDKIFSGRVKHINPTVNEADRSVKVIAEVENKSGELKGGLFAKGKILTGAKRNVLQVPRSALVGINMTAKKAGLFVVAEDRARFREVTTGAITGDQIEIASGLKPGERLVVRGSFNLKDSDRVIISGEHGK